MAKRIILNITPETWVRVTQRDKIFFRIPRDKLYPSGLKRLLRIEKYNNYKVSLLATAKEKQFAIPSSGCGVTFYIPCPRTWSNKKKKQFHGQLHQSRPDLKNLLSAWEDGLCSEDKYIAHYAHLCKRWVNYETGWIEITDHNYTMEPVEMPSVEGEKDCL